MGRCRHLRFTARCYRTRIARYHLTPDCLTGGGGFPFPHTPHPFQPYSPPQYRRSRPAHPPVHYHCRFYRGSATTCALPLLPPLVGSCRVGWMLPDTTSRQCPVVRRATTYTRFGGCSCLPSRTPTATCAVPAPCLLPTGIPTPATATCTHYRLHARCVYKQQNGGNRRRRNAPWRRAAVATAA